MVPSKVLLITANLGSIFEEPDKMIPVWLKEFFRVLEKTKPLLIGLHCQEVGGKKYEETMQFVDKFIKLLLSSPELKNFDKIKIFLDEDFTAIEKFTALGSIYLIEKKIKKCSIYNFKQKTFQPIQGKEVFTGNIENNPLKEKAKFPQEFFPDFIWSRKGFMRTRWNFEENVFDLINLHLFHDNSNILAMDTSPSLYRVHREQALSYIIEKLEKDEHQLKPFFIFGDFNFRLDTHHLVKNITENLEIEKIKGKKNDISTILFKKNNQVILKVGKKEFLYNGEEKLFGAKKIMDLKKYDVECDIFENKLFEYKVTFPPSYPYSEDIDKANIYMTTRCPGWCDRILMSHQAFNIINNEETPEYEMMGPDICMGDHKPIYLSLSIKKEKVKKDISTNSGCLKNLLFPQEKVTVFQSPSNQFSSQSLPSSPPFSPSLTKDLSKLIYSIIGPSPSNFTSSLSSASSSSTLVYVEATAPSSSSSSSSIFPPSSHPSLTNQSFKSTSFDDHIYQYHYIKNHLTPQQPPLATSIDGEDEAPSTPLPPPHHYGNRFSLANRSMTSIHVYKETSV